MDGLGWLSSQLALRGAMVLAVNHPGSTMGDSSPRRSIRLDERAADLRAALDTVLSDPSFGPHIDTKRITSLGFSLGGTTALNLAGARLDRGLYKDYRTRFKDQGDCVFFSKGGVDFARLPEPFESDMRDPRIASAIALGLALPAVGHFAAVAGSPHPQDGG
jgi:predicted dienelactone hydrolase